MVTLPPACTWLALLTLTHPVQATTFHRHEIPRTVPSAYSRWVPVPQTHTGVGKSPGKAEKIVPSSFPSEDETVRPGRLSRRHGYYSVPDYPASHRNAGYSDPGESLLSSLHPQDSRASPRQSSAGLTVAGIPVGLANELFQNVGGFTLWLNLLLVNKMKHDDVTRQIQVLTSELEDTKSSLLTKLENNAEVMEELFHNVSSILETSGGILEHEVDSSGHLVSHHSLTNSLEAPVSAVSLATGSSTGETSPSLSDTSSLTSSILAQILAATDSSPHTSSSPSSVLAQTSSGTFTSTSGSSALESLVNSDEDREGQSLSQDLTNLGLPEFEDEAEFFEALLNEIVKRRRRIKRDVENLKNEFVGENEIQLFRQLSGIVSNSTRHQSTSQTVEGLLATIPAILEEQEESYNKISDTIAALGTSLVRTRDGEKEKNTLGMSDEAKRSDLSIHAGDTRRPDKTNKEDKSLGSKLGNNFANIIIKKNISDILSVEDIFSEVEKEVGFNRNLSSKPINLKTLIKYAKLVRNGSTTDSNETEKKINEYFFRQDVTRSKTTIPIITPGTDGHTHTGNNRSTHYSDNTDQGHKLDHGGKAQKKASRESSVAKGDVTLEVSAEQEADRVREHTGVDVSKIPTEERALETPSMKLEMATLEVKGQDTGKVEDAPVVGIEARDVRRHSPRVKLPLQLSQNEQEETKAKELPSSRRISPKFGGM